jgi:hypothetical protein
MRTGRVRKPIDASAAETLGRISRRSTCQGGTEDVRGERVLAFGECQRVRSREPHGSGHDEDGQREDDAEE